MATGSVCAVSSMSAAASLGRVSRLLEGSSASSSSPINMLAGARLTGRSAVRRAGFAGIRAQAGETEASTATAASHINPGIRKEEPKVVDSVVASELDKPLVAYCRCWRSEKFPLCDGAHAKFNKETGDNVGPLLVKK
ncbi:hypothetical protein CBR_g49669 [Chara braunii]|uniref:Iron-binding zinc finger CDGSH type domain-containing protein n=1 Tax=Chara braunii TaxID=69332 RepID=A0A388M5R2_CHABU|nr:hypothetical protein CBR_g49669 [Chara braunii]|eukprot:GBG89819.1 hypothetical protein CBR_g49669 [Chara braunii]